MGTWLVEEVFGGALGKILVEEACRDGYIKEVKLPPKHTFGSGSGQCEFEATLEEYEASLPVPGFQARSKDQEI